MTYASSAAPSVPAILDADSHLMELPDFLSRHVERSMRNRIPTLDQIRLADVGEQMRTYRNAREHAPETVAELVALGDRITRRPKWHGALGAFNGRERGLALDLLGFQRQVVFSSFCATKPHLGEFRREPSEQFREQLCFTPYPFEDVGALIRESMPELYLFSSDYPHAEGGRDPIGRFNRALAGIGEADQALFFGGNFGDLFGAGDGVAA